MKTSLYIIFLFFSFQVFSQDGELVASRESDTVKRVFENGKVGLVHTDGRQILEPEYSDLRMEAHGIRLFNDDLQGYLPKGSKKIIPAKYKGISPNNVYFEAQNESGTIDLYFGSELIASDLDSGPGMEDILPINDLVIIRKEEKAGIIDQKGTIIVPMDYAVIESVPSFVYILKDSILFNYILVLDKSDYFYSPESEGFLRLGEPVLYLAKGDGTLITDSVFSEVSPDLEKNEFELGYHEKMAVMNNRFEIAFLPYISITEFMEWKFCSTGEETILFNRFNQAIDTFHHVEIPYRNVPVLSEDGVEISYYDEVLFKDFIYVWKSGEEGSEMAIYDLKSQKIVSDWKEKITFVSRWTNPSGAIVWVFKDETGKLAFSTSTRGESSAFEYQDIYQVSNQFYAFKKEGGTLYTLCELVQDSIFKPIIPIEKSFGSLNYIGMNTLSVQEIDSELLKGSVDEFGNYYSSEMEEDAEGSRHAFRTPFTLFKNANGKLGFISWNGKVVDLNADTLFQFFRFNTLIDYRVGDLWGAADIMWAADFKPDQTDWGRFHLLEGASSLIYRLESDQYYVDHKGREFYSINPERSISKRGRNKGANVYSDFDSDGMLTNVAIPYVYSELLPTWNSIDFLAQGSNKKWGIISAFNDTVFPFKYDKLEFVFDQPDNKIQTLFPYRDYDQQCATRIGKFHGLLSLNLKKEIPAIYDDVQYVTSAAFIVRKNGKTGVYDYNLNERIKPVFDEIFIAAPMSGIYILRALKDGLWYNLEFYEGKVPDQNTLLQAIPCNFVIDEQGYVKKESTYEIINLMDGSISEKMALPELLLDSKHLKLVDEKIYLVDAKGKLLYPNGLTNMVVQEDHVISVENGIMYTYSLLKKEKKVFTE